MNLYIDDFQLHILGLIFHQLDYLDIFKNYQLNEISQD